jgi:hypothetical protein
MTTINFTNSELLNEVSKLLSNPNPYLSELEGLYIKLAKNTQENEDTAIEVKFNFADTTFESYGILCYMNMVINAMKTIATYKINCKGMLDAKAQYIENRAYLLAAIQKLINTVETYVNAKEEGKTVEVVGSDVVVTWSEEVVVDSTDINGVDCKESITRLHRVVNGEDIVVEISNGYIVEGVSLSDEEYEKQWNAWYGNYQSSLKKVVNKAPKNVCRIRKSDSLSRLDSMKKAVKFFRDARGAQLTINNYYKPNNFNHIILIRNTQDNLRKAKEIHKRLSLNNELDTYLSD